MLGIVITYGLELAVRALSKVQRAIWFRTWPRKYVEGYKRGSCVADIGRSGYSAVAGEGYVPLDRLRVRLRTPEGLDFRRVEESPHYELIRDIANGVERPQSSVAYKHYIRTYEPDMDPEERVVELRKLVASVADSFRSETSNVFMVVAAPAFSLHLNVLFPIVDGVHRACIAKSLGVTKVRVMLTVEE